MIAERMPTYAEVAAALSPVELEAFNARLDALHQTMAERVQTDIERDLRRRLEASETQRALLWRTLERVLEDRRGR